MEYINIKNNNVIRKKQNKEINLHLIVCSLLLFVFFTCINVGNVHAYSNDCVKVGIKYGAKAVISSILYCNEGFSIGVNNEGKYSENMPISGYTSLVVTNERGIITVKAEDGTLISSDIGRNGVIMPFHYQDSNYTITIDGIQYRGGATYFANNDGTLNVINYISIDDYVKGVLNSEMNYKNPIEALKAQAVTARSFVLGNMHKHESSGFDICDGTDCQVYKGYSDEHAETNKAADETSGIRMYFEGKPATVYYHKNSGGYTQNIKDVWGSNANYLVAVKDNYSPEYNWVKEISFSDIESKLIKQGINIGLVNSVEIAERNQTGAVSILKINGSFGQYSLEKEKIRAFFGYTDIKSRHFSFDANFVNNGINNNQGTGNISGNDISGNGNLTIYNGKEKTNIENNMTVIGAEGKTVNIDTKTAYISNGQVKYCIKDGINSNINNQKDIENTQVLQSEICNSTPFTIYGKGYGHGIGMAQDSAIAMAQQGCSYQEILKYFYSNITLQ